MGDGGTGKWRDRRDGEKETRETAVDRVTEEKWGEGRGREGETWRKGEEKMARRETGKQRDMGKQDGEIREDEEAGDRKMGDIRILYLSSSTT